MYSKSVKEIDYEFQTGIKKYRTPVSFSTPCNDVRILDALEDIGAEIKYETERTVYLFLDGIHLTLGHNWDGQRKVDAQSTGLGLKIGENTEKKVKRAVERAVNHKITTQVFVSRNRELEKVKETFNM